MKSCVTSMRVRWLCLTALLVLSGNSFGVLVNGVTGQLKLLATINGEPAFREVVWHLTPLKLTNKNTRNIELTITRHSAVVDLEAGKYQVHASAGSKTETQVITIEEGGTHHLVLNLR
ncbi:hypothetical protein [Thiothrix eikelboomii]|uniref:Uncharacterized protein n=1 Tax=Thiothrix eikelboomii TaxID=92487 RepID=A0A1T4WKD3_9GAMM|nr:hypothetical protein [Thiothrix eikelboomii]SKA77368.1 hypothetical protein SAMN02745130_01787 [Thiothrix eikelboomii]